MARTLDGKRRGALSPERRVAPLIAAALALLALAPVCALGQGTPDSIFGRFAIDRNPQRDWQALFEMPADLRSVNNPNADMVENTGLNYLISYGAQNRIYLSRGYLFGKMEWKPKEPNVDKERVIEFGMSDYLNFRVRPWLVVSTGLGLGVMSGLIIYKGDQGFQTRLEPFIPLHFGLIVPIGSRIVVSMKLSQSTYFGPGPGLSVTRLLGGFGFNY